MPRLAVQTGLGRPRLSSHRGREVLGRYGWMSSAVHTSSRVCTEPTVATGNLEADAGAANLVLEPNAFLVWDLKNLR